MSEGKIVAPVWEAEQLRFTIFRVPSSVAEAPTINWRLLTGRDPEQVTSRPARGLTQEVGPFENGVLVLSMQQPARIDVVWQQPPSGSSPRDLASMPPYEQIHPRFCQLIERLIPEMPTCIRLAYAPTCFLQTSSVAEGWAQIFRALGLESWHEQGFEEPVIQFNRPKSSLVVDDLRINRIERWQTSQFAVVEALVRPRAAAAVTEVQPQVFGVSLTLDYNTDAKRSDPLPREKSRDLVGELLELPQKFLAEVRA